MLCSSGDFPRTLSSILSGEGLDEREQGNSPLVFGPVTGRPHIPRYTLRTTAERLRPIRGWGSVGAAKRLPGGPSTTMRRFYLHVAANSGVASSAS